MFSVMGKSRLKVKGPRKYKKGKVQSSSPRMIWKTRAQLEKIARNRKSHKGQRLNAWNPLNRQEALINYKKQRFADYHGAMTSIRGLAKEFSVPYQTLQRRTAGKVTGYEHKSGGKCKPRILSTNAEDELVQLLEDFAAAGFPLTGGEVKQVAFQYAQENGITGFSNKYEHAGPAWLRGFLNRNPSLKWKKPINLSINRAIYANPTIITHWFEHYIRLLADSGIVDPCRIWNIDETGLQDIPNKRQGGGC